jgi:hypothetical protein
MVSSDDKHATFVFREREREDAADAQHQVNEAKMGPARREFRQSVARQL